MPIPTEVVFSNCTFIRAPMVTALEVFQNINIIRHLLEAHGWDFKGKFKAKTTLTFGGVVPFGGAFSKIIYDYLGFGFQVFNSAIGDRDPTGDLVGGDFGTNTFIGVDMAGLESDSDGRNTRFIAAMNKVGLPTWQVSIPVDDEGHSLGPATLLVEEKLEDDVQRNDFFWFGNILSGYQFNGPTKFGGWILESSPSDAVGISRLHVGFYSTPSDNFVMDISFVGGPDAPSVTLPPFYTWKRPDLWMVINPYMWIVGDLGDFYVNQNVTEVNEGASDLWICVPRCTQGNLLDPGHPIKYAGFMSTSPRTQLHDRNCTTYINGWLRQVNNSGATDCGMSLIPINSMYQAEGDLYTTTHLPILISSIIGLSEKNDTSDELKLMGDCYDMYLSTKYYPLNAYFYRSTDHRLVFAYRSQKTPVSATLLCAVDTFNPWLDGKPHPPGDE